MVQQQANLAEFAAGPSVAKALVNHSDSTADRARRGSRWWPRWHGWWWWRQKVKIEIDVEVALLDAELALSIALCLLGKQYTTTRRILLEACGLASIDAIDSMSRAA